MRSLVLVCALSCTVSALAQSTTDAWDISKGTKVTSHSELDHDPPAERYDIRDLFGGRFSGYAPERGHVVFYDGAGGPGFIDEVEWESPKPLGIKSYTLYWKDDFPYQDWRNLGHFKLYGKLREKDSWKLLVTRDTMEGIGLGTLMGSLSGDPYKYWRAEFTRGSGRNLSALAPRIIELDGWTEPPAGRTSPAKRPKRGKAAPPRRGKSVRPS